MPPRKTYAIALILVFAGNLAQATVACSVLPEANLFSEPNKDAEIIRPVPADDLVLYPQQELAPEQAENWIWVRHDPTQEDIWQGGDYGWMPQALLTDCG